MKKCLDMPSGIIAQWVTPGTPERITRGTPEPFAERVERLWQKALGEKGSRLFLAGCFWQNISPDFTPLIISILLGETRRNEDLLTKFSTRSANGSGGPLVILS
jgi:hypothetical protein